jgi:O-antigen ligase
LFLNISILLYNRLYLINKIAFILIALIFLEVLIEIKSFIEVSDSFSLSAAFRQLSGNTGSINIFAANLATKVPFLLYGIFTFSKFKKWLSMVTLFLAAILILLTASRASLLGLSTEVIVFLIFLFKFDSNKKVYFKHFVTIIIPMIVAYFLANQIMEFANDDSKRFQSVSNRASQIVELDDSSIDKRMKLWQNAIEISKENPTLGIGLGNWQIESIPYEKLLANDLRTQSIRTTIFLKLLPKQGF